MPYLRLLLLATAMLAGCTVTGGNGSGIGGGGSAAPEFADSSTDTFQSKMVNGGVTGSMAILNLLASAASRDEVKVEVAADFQTAWLTVNGARIQMTAQGVPGTINGGLYQDGSGLRAMTFGTPISTDFMSTLYYSDGIGQATGLGIIGAETRPGNLPSTSATYSGLYQFTSNPTSPSVGGTGFTDIDVNFGTGNVSGQFRDGVNSTDVFGTVSGTVSGNGFNGNLAISDTVLSGTMTLSGTFYGPAAEQVGGIMEGSVFSTSDGNVLVVGIFTGTR